MYILIRGDNMDTIWFILRILCKVLYVLFLYEVVMLAIDEMYAYSLKEAIKICDKSEWSKSKRDIYNWICVIKFACVCFGGLIWMPIMIDTGFSMISGLR